MNQLIRTSPFDLYELTLFRLVVEQGSFTKAAALARLTQSAVTRQIKGMETALGIQLLERTTRTVRVTPAGQFLCREAGRLLGDVDQSLSALNEQFGTAKKEVRVDISRSIGLAYLPGFFHANLRRLPDIRYRVSCQASDEILQALEANEQDIGLLCPPPRLPKTLRITHAFEDDFTFIAPATLMGEFQNHSTRRRKTDWLLAQSWLLLDEQSNTGRSLRKWILGQGWNIEPTMQLDNFDLIIQLVALGMGVSLVPIRALALYNQKQKIVRFDLPQKFTRQLVVVVRKRKPLGAHVEQFIENVLF